MNSLIYILFLCSQLYFVCIICAVVVAKSSYVIKVNGRPSEEYWLSLMRTWLSSIQKHLDVAIKKGQINPVTGEMKADIKITDEAKIARRLVCSYGNIYNCTGRVSIYETFTVLF